MGERTAGQRERGGEGERDGARGDRGGERSWKVLRGRASQRGSRACVAERMSEETVAEPCTIG
jgi:hypothetical protein